LRQVDAYLWTGVPGNSAGSCNGGPPAGTFWSARAIGLAARASNRIG
jgi:endoglucanase